MTAEEQGLQQAVFDERPPWLLMGVYADWLEDQNRPLEAEAWRWMAAKQRRVHHATRRHTNHPFRWVRLKPDVEPRFYEMNYSRFACLPGELTRLMTCEVGDSDLSQWYREQASAYADLMRAFAALPPDVRQELWQWEPPT